MITFTILYNVLIYLLKYLSLKTIETNHLYGPELKALKCIMQNEENSKHNAFSGKSKFVFKIKIKGFFLEYVVNGCHQ